MVCSLLVYCFEMVFVCIFQIDQKNGDAKYLHYFELFCVLPVSHLYAAYTRFA